MRKSGSAHDLNDRRAPFVPRPVRLIGTPDTSRCEGSSCMASGRPPASGTVQSMHRSADSRELGAHREYTAEPCPPDRAGLSCVSTPRFECGCGRRGQGRRHGGSGDRLGRRCGHDRNPGRGCRCRIRANGGLLPLPGPWPLRRAARSTQARIGDIATNLLETGQLPTDPKSGPPPRR